MTCKCGREIVNVPEHLKDLASWVCKECSNAPPPNALTDIAAHTTGLPADLDVHKKSLRATQAA